MGQMGTWQKCGISRRWTMLKAAESTKDGLIALTRTCGDSDLQFLAEMHDGEILPRCSRMGRKEIKAFLRRYQATEGRDGWFDCGICGQSNDTANDQNTTLDHGALRSEVVFNNIQNVILACRRCNSLRGNRYTISYTRDALRQRGVRVDVKAAVWATQRVQRMVILIMRLEALHALWLLPGRMPASDNE